MLAGEIGWPLMFFGMPTYPNQVAQYQYPIPVKAQSVWEKAFDLIVQAFSPTGAAIIVVGLVVWFIWVKFGKGKT